MGIGKAFSAAVRGTMADQWLEAFSCDALPADLLAVRGRRMQSDRSANQGDENIITPGSIILVPDGACAIVTEMGDVIAAYETPGEHTFDGKKGKGIFGGGGISGMLHDAGQRFTFGGDAAIVQRVLFINTKEIPENEFDVPPFSVRLRDPNTTLDLDATVSAHGFFSMRITDSLRFYRKVCGNVSGTYARQTLLPQLRAEMRHLIAPVLANLCADGVRPYALAEFTEQIASAVQRESSARWCESRGIEVVSVAFDALSVTPDAQKTVQEAQRTKMLTDPAMAAATLTGAMADALPAAAANGAGALAGFMLAANTPAQSKLWHCACGRYNTGRFCEDCGKAKP